MGFQNHYFYDSMNRGGSAASMGSNWYVPVGAFSIVSNTAVGTDPTNVSLCPLTGFDLVVSVAIVASGHTSGPVGRWNGTEGYVALLGPGLLTLGLVNSSGTVTTLASVSTAATSGLVGLACNSTQISLSLNGTVLLTVLDSTLSGSGQIGIVNLGGSSSLSFFEGSTPLEYGGSCCQ